MRVTPLGLFGLLACCLLVGAVAVSLLFARVEREQRDIQQSRLADCQDANQRHTATVNVLDSLYAAADAKARTPAEKQRLRQVHASTLLLIDALAPKQNCDAVVH